MPYRTSAFLPEYLKAELGLGTPNPNPLVEALDEVSDGLMLLAHQVARRTVPDHWPVERCRRALCDYGFHLEKLFDDEVRTLFEFRGWLLRRRGSLDAPAWLANLYFGEARVIRGYPHRGDQLRSRLRLPLQAIDGDGPNNTISAIVPNAATRERMQEFAQNAELLIPDRFTIRVFTEVGNIFKIRAGYPVGFGMRLEPRRL